jgi:outer membrane protein assembly factor BamD (BamD/ComL family)
VVAAPAPVVVPSAPVAVEAPAPRPAPVKRARPSAHAEAPANRLAEETALLAAANGELRNGDARRALGLLDDYDRRYPSGVLREEVLATRVIARCQIGLAPDATARRAANTFLTRHPASPLAPRVRSSCGR